VTRGSASLLDRSFTIAPGQSLRNIVVTFTDKRTSLDVRVTDDNGQPTTEYVALAFPVDKDRWTPNSRYIQTFSPPAPEMLSFMAQQRQSSSATPGVAQVPPRRDGFLNLPPGEYYVIAVSDVDREATRDPATLAELAADATRVTLAEGEKGVVDLRVKK
jgi:hypothetical protein